ncbi:helix-turn-helix domain-containing protein [Arthrobacter alpinus]|nr:helix-turn-helix domain-containing protein [Arthrobacter alpinus]
MRAITINHVAEAAGVSIGTVSKALNGTGRVSSDTRERVLQEAARLGFVPRTRANSGHLLISLIPLVCSPPIVSDVSPIRSCWAPKTLWGRAG